MNRTASKRTSQRKPGSTVSRGAQSWSSHPRNTGQPSSSSALSSLSMSSGGRRAVHGGRQDGHASHLQVITSSSMSLPSPRRMITLHSSHYGTATTASTSAEPASRRRQYSECTATPSHMNDHVSSILSSPSRQHVMMLEHRQEQQQQQRHHPSPSPSAIPISTAKGRITSTTTPHPPSMMATPPSHLQQHHQHQHHLQQYRRQRHTPLYGATTTTTTMLTTTTSTAHAAYHTIPYTLTRRGAQQQPPVYHLHSTDHPHSMRMIGIPITYRFPMELLPSLEFISTHGQQRVSHLSRDECWIVDMTPKALQTPNIIIYTKDGHYVALDVAMTMCVSDAVTFIGLGDEYVDHLTLACERAAQFVGQSSTHRDVVDPQYHSFYTSQIHDYLQQLCEGMGVDVLHVQFTARPYTMTHVTAQLRLLDDLAARGEHVLGGNASGSEGKSGNGSDAGDADLGRNHLHQHDDKNASHTHHANHHNSDDNDNKNHNTNSRQSSSTAPPSSSSPPRLLASYRIKSQATTSSPSSPSSPSTSAGSSSRTSTIKRSKQLPHRGSLR